MRKIKPVFAVGLVFVMMMFFRSPLAAQSVQTGEGSLPRFQIEIMGGLSGSNPVDFNLRPEYDLRFLDDQREFYAYYNPGLQQPLPFGEFNQVKSILPFGFRLKYRLSRRFSISLGLKAYEKNQSSEVSARFRSGGGDYALDFAYSPYSIFIHGYAPLLGVHFSIGNFNRFGLEYFLSGGPLFAECGYQIAESRSYSRNEQVYRLYETSYNIDGNSTGISLNSGLRLEYQFHRGFKFFCEGGYSYQAVRNLHGSGEYIFAFYRSPSEREVSDQLNWEGYWGIKETDDFAPLPSNEWEKDDSRMRSFKLDLSGMFLQVGISFSFSLH